MINKTPYHPKEALLLVRLMHGVMVTGVPVIAAGSFILYALHGPLIKDNRLIRIFLIIVLLLASVCILPVNFIQEKDG